MKDTRIIPFTLISVLTLVSLTQPFAQNRRTVIAVGTLLDGRGQTIRNTRIIVEGATIRAIDSTASPVDYNLSSSTVMPGWIDTHVHLSWHFNATR